MMRNKGFSMLELLIVLVVLLIITGAVFQVIKLTTERSSTEQTKLDMVQEAREFMDQMSRDLRQAGYPNQRNFGPGVLTTTPSEDLRVAAGLIKVGYDELWFEADVDGLGAVSVIRYYLDTSPTNNCPCLKRSQLPKVQGNPYTGQTAPVYQVEVQGVTNTSIFTAFNNGALLPLPLNFNANPMAMAGLDTIQAVLSLQGATIDLKTRTKPTTTLVTTVRLNNCSMASAAQQTSCE
jgi:prepilin-type N-terminal cleavage/methylation domain-containing protein